jgi:hypothetical protein
LDLNWAVILGITRPPACRWSAVDLSASIITWGNPKINHFHLSLSHQFCFSREPWLIHLLSQLKVQCRGNKYLNIKIITQTTSNTS